MAARTLLGLVVAFTAYGAAAQSDSGQIIQELQKLAWQRSPGVGEIGSKATIRIPGGYAFLDEPNTRRFLELMGNPPRDGHYLIAPASLDWFAVFSYDPVGYVKDDEKIDAAALLESLRNGDAPGNDERKRLGMAPVFTDGWQFPPHYDADTKRLEWGMRLRDERGDMHINYTSRLLGRRGVMSAVLVSSPRTLNEDVKSFDGALAGYRFNAGEQYAEFKSGDKVAEHGLGALVLGGAAAEAGWIKRFGNLLGVVVVAGLIGSWVLLKKCVARKAIPENNQ